MLIVADHIGFLEWSDPRMKTLREIEPQGAIGLMVTKTETTSVRSNISELENAAYMTIGSGVPARGDDDGRLAFNTNELVEDRTAGLVYSLVTGYGNPAAGMIVHLGIGSQSDLNAETSYKARPGELGAILKKGGVRTAAIGNSDWFERSERGASWGLKTAAWSAIAFLHIPLALIILYAFSAEDKSYVFPPPALTTQWFGVAWQREDVWAAIKLSFEVAAWSTAVAVLLGALAAAALARASFFGRDAISLLLILPIALPGVITGIALRSAYGTLHIPFSFWTIVIGHATFCVVVVFNNAIARLRRLNPNLIEASMDLGADGFQTVRHIVLPQLGSALLAGALLAFALSFDEVIVTTFTAGQQTTLPIWMFKELIRPHQRPVTNVAAIIVMIITFGPILLAYYLTRDTQDVAGSGK